MRQEGVLKKKAATFSLVQLVYVDNCIWRYNLLSLILKILLIGLIPSEQLVLQDKLFLSSCLGLFNRDPAKVDSAPIKMRASLPATQSLLGSSSCWNGKINTCSLTRGGGGGRSV